MSQPHSDQRSQQPLSATLPPALLPLLALAFVLLILIVGGGLIYVTFTHPSAAVPLTVAAAGVTLVFTIAGVLVALVAAQRR